MGIMVYVYMYVYTYRHIYIYIHTSLIKGNAGFISSAYLVLAGSAARFGSFLFEPLNPKP